MPGRPGRPKITTTYRFRGPRNLGSKILFQRENILDRPQSAVGRTEKRSRTPATAPWITAFVKRGPGSFTSRASMRLSSTPRIRLLFSALVLWAGRSTPLTACSLHRCGTSEQGPAVVPVLVHGTLSCRLSTLLRLRGGRGGEDSAPSASTRLCAPADWSAGVTSQVSDVTGMVSTIFFSSSEGSNDDMDLPQVLPVSDIASRSLDRDYQEFTQDQHLPPLTREWAGDLPRTGRQYLRHVRRDAALNYMPVRPLVTKRIIDPRDYVPAALADACKDSLDSDLAGAEGGQGEDEPTALGAEDGARAPRPGTNSPHAVHVLEEDDVDGHPGRASQGPLGMDPLCVPARGGANCETREARAGPPVLVAPDARACEKELALKAAEWARNYTQTYLLSAPGNRREERVPRVLYSRRLLGPPSPAPSPPWGAFRLAAASWRSLRLWHMLGAHRHGG